MSARCSMLGLFAIGLLASSSYAQSSAAATLPETPPEDRSFYLNQPVDHPEALSGVWETSNGHGGAVGIHIELMTSVSDDADPPAWTPQLWQHLELGVFERKGPELVFGEEGYFADDLRGGGVTLKNGRLQLHFVSRWEDTPSVDLDLLHQPDDCWRGRFHRGGFDSVVTLCRPTPDSTVTPSPLVGTWSSDYGGCIHIFESEPGTFTGWSDALQIPGRTIYGRSEPEPHGLLEAYGDLAKVNLDDSGEVSLEFNAYSGFCCSQLLKGKLSADGSTIQGRFATGLNQFPHTAKWTKMPGDSCVKPSTLPKHPSAPCPDSEK
jgi:hypothetical protein